MRTGAAAGAAAEPADLQAAAGNAHRIQAAASAIAAPLPRKNVRRGSCQGLRLIEAPLAISVQ